MGISGDLGRAWGDYLEAMAHCPELRNFGRPERWGHKDKVPCVFLEGQEDLGYWDRI